MSEARKDTKRAHGALLSIVDGRGLADRDAIMVTLEHAVAGVLLALYPDHRTAAGVLNEGLVQGVESRIALHQSKSEKRTTP